MTNSMQGTRRVIMGVVNDRSIARAISQVGAELAFICLGDGIAAEFIPAGHFLGRDSDPLMRSLVPFGGADVLVCESTYGYRLHEPVDAEAELAAIIHRVAGRGGTILIPAFTVERAQGLMYHIAQLRQRGDIPDVPVFLNNPMATDATEITTAITMNITSPGTIARRCSISPRGSAASWTPGS